MTKTEDKTAVAAVKDILLSNPDGLHEVLRAVIQEVLEAEMDEALGAAKGQGDHRRTVRACVLGLIDLGDQQAAR